jgi:hypothetical protein
MATITVTDQASPTASLEVSDDSTLALANLKNLKFSNLPILGDFAKAIDQSALKQVELGVSFAPSIPPPAGVSLALSGGVSATLGIYRADQKKLFGDDEFAPEIKIGPGECWAGFGLNVSIQVAPGEAVNGFGVSISVGSSFEATTYMHFPPAGLPMPTFKDGLAALLESYSVPTTAGQLRSMPLGIVHASEATGSIELGAYYSAPFTVNPLATLGGLPFNLTLSVAPAVVATLEGSVKLEGSFAVRAYRTSETKLILGVFKKHQTSVSASLTSSAGVGLYDNSTDILAKLLDAVVPAADLDSLQLEDSQKSDLSDALKHCADQSISIAMNACCTASVADEAAVVYELDLGAANPVQTDGAISAAMLGDWGKLGRLSNAKCLRNIVAELHDRNHKININLLGLYNATSLADYLNSTTVLQDENGQISLVDKSAAKSLSAGVTPYAAKSDKLRSALAQAFVATITYGASGGKLGVKGFAVSQSLLEYKAQANTSDLTRQILLARSVGLAKNAAWDAILRSSATFSHDKFSLETGYDLTSVYRLFYQDVEARTPHAPETLDSIGRQAKIALLDPAATNSMQRRNALSNDVVWNAMNSDGNVVNFRFIPGLAKLDPTAIAAISADWIDIRWWSDAMQSLTPKLSEVLQAIAQATSVNPLADAAFMAAHKNLEKALSNLAANTRSAFADGWPIAVMARLAASTAGPGPSLQMDIGWNGQYRHEEAGMPSGKVQTAEQSFGAGGA